MFGRDASQACERPAFGAMSWSINRGEHSFRSGQEKTPKYNRREAAHCLEVSTSEDPADALHAMVANDDPSKAMVCVGDSCLGSLAGGAFVNNDHRPFAGDV